MYTPLVNVHTCIHVHVLCTLIHICTCTQTFIQLHQYHLTQKKGVYMYMYIHVHRYLYMYINTCTQTLHQYHLTQRKIIIHVHVNINYVHDIYMY